MPRHLPRGVAQILVLGLAALGCIIVPPSCAGKTYGNRATQERQAILQSDFSPASKEPSPHARNPKRLDYDYHFLYEPADLETGIAYRNRRIPLVNPHRGFGLPIWGSLVGASAEPTSLLLAIIPQQGLAHVARASIFVLISLLGTFLLLRSTFDCGVAAATIGAIMYAFSPFMFYFWHWLNLLAIVSLFPFGLHALLRFLATERPRWAAAWMASLVWMLLANQAQVLLYALLCFSLWVLGWGACSWRSLGPAAVSRRALKLSLLALAALCLTLGHTWHVWISASNSARTPVPDPTSLYPYLAVTTPDNLLRILGLYTPDDGFYWYRPFTWGAGALLMGVAAGFQRGKRRPVPPQVLLLSFLFGFYSLVFVVGWIDYPLHLVLPKLYSATPNTLRGLFPLYLMLGCLCALTLDRIANDASSRTLDTLLGSSLSACGMLNLFPNLTVGFAWGQWSDSFSNYLERALRDDISPFFSIWALLGAGSLLLGLPLLMRAASLRQPGSALRLAPRLGVFLFGVSIFASGIRLGQELLPFEDANEASLPERPAALEPNGSGFYDLPCRTTRLWDFEKYLEQTYSPRLAHDSFLPLHLSSLTGYHTSMTGGELGVFHHLYPNALKSHAERYWANWGFAEFHTYLPRAAIVDGEGVTNLEALNYLRGLGVGYLLDTSTIPGFSMHPSRDVAPLRVHTLEGCSIARFIPANAEQVETRSNQPWEYWRDRLIESRPLNVRRNPRTDSYLIDRPGESGTLVLTLDLKRHFRAQSSGRALAIENVDLPFTVVHLATEDEQILIAPDPTSLRGITLLGLVLGIGLLGLAQLPSMRAHP